LPPIAPIVWDEPNDYTPEPYPVAVKLVDEGGRDRDVCDGDDHPNMTDLISAVQQGEQP
jgi:hypothetical protein